MAQPVTISTGGVVNITDQNVIISGKAPISVTWDLSAFDTYYIFNSLSVSIPAPIGYFDVNNVFQTSIPPSTYLQISLTGEAWFQITGDESTATSLQINSNTTNVAANWGIARVGILGVVQPDGTTIVIDSNGTIHADGSFSQVQSDWNESDNSQVDYIKNKPLLATVATSGSYTDLTSKPTIPAAQVNSDWTAVSGISVILHKPTIPAAQIQSDWNEANASLLDYIKNKPTIPPVLSLTTIGSSGPSTYNGGTGAMNIPNYVGGGGGGPTPTCLPIASAVGILANGSDQTAALNTFFSNSLYAGIVIDYTTPAVITINGTVNAQGKIIIFANQNGFTSSGSGVINNAVLSAGFRQKLFDTTVSLTNCSVANEKFSALWYGSLSGTYEVTFQKCIDTVIANQAAIRTLFFPCGNYVITKPLIAYSWSGVIYNSISIRLEGETPMWQRSGTSTTITTSGYKDTFALGIQCGKGVEVKQLKFVGGFTPPFSADTYGFFTCPFDSFTDGVSRDTANSAYCGVVIDPFGPSIFSDGGYPGYNGAGASPQYYRGGSNGSTGVILEDIFITNFVIGFTTSINGGTSNGELVKVDKIQFENCKVCVAGCQDQEKLNVVTQLACWGNTHTIFVSGTYYGKPGPGHWVFNGINLAGSINQLIIRSGIGFFPVHFSNVYAESIGSIGSWSGSQGDSFRDSIIDFVNLTVFLAYPQNSHFVAVGVTVRNVSFRYYDTVAGPIWLNGGVYEDCTFTTLPYGGTLRNCVVGPWVRGAVNATDDNLDQAVSASRYFSGGRGRYIDSLNYNQGKRICLNNTEVAFGGILNLDGINNSASTVSITSNIATVTPPTAGDLVSATVGRLAIDINTGLVLGIITAIGGSTYTIGYVPNGVVSGSYTVGQWHPIFNLSFMGTITSGSNLITGVVLDFGLPSEIISAGGQLSGFVRIPGFYGVRAYSQQAKIISYNSGTGVITMDRNASENATNFYFASNSCVKEISTNSDSSGSGSGIPASMILPKGSYFYDNVPGTGRRVYIVTQTGYFTSSPTAVLSELT